MRKIHCSSFLLCASFCALSVFTAHAEPIREWDWHLPAKIYKELDFSDRAGVDRAVKLFEKAIEAERSRVKVTDLVPRYRAAAGEWRKVQVQAETAGGNESLLAYAVFMQGYAKQQAHDRNDAMKLFNEVLDIYPDEKFIAVPARYMLSLVKRQMGDIKEANAELEAIVEDGGADGHTLYYSVLRALAANRWAEGRLQEAADMWEKIVFSKGTVDPNVRRWSRENLIVARLIGLDFENLMAVLMVGASNRPTAKRDELAANANWVSEIDAYGHHPVTQALDTLYPRDKKASERRAKLEKIRKGYARWFDSEASAFDGTDDGWTLAFLRLKVNRSIDKADAFKKRMKDLEGLLKRSKADVLNARARALALAFCTYGQSDDARAVAAIPTDILFRLRLQYEVENSLKEWKMATMYLEQYINTKPSPPEDDLKNAKYDLAWIYRYRLGDNEKALKIYQELNDPPRSLWAMAEVYRALGKKKESYTTLTEIVSVFPNDAPNGVLRMAQWKEEDGEKQTAIGLYRRLMNHPQWKQSGASSQAHQALERLGIATGGAMTNQVR